MPRTRKQFSINMGVIQGYAIVTGFQFFKYAKTQKIDLNLSKWAMICICGLQ